MCPVLDRAVLAAEGHGAGLSCVAGDLQPGAQGDACPDNQRLSAPPYSVWIGDA